MTIRISPSSTYFPIISIETNSLTAYHQNDELTLQLASDLSMAILHGSDHPPHSSYGTWQMGH
jgi:hypothetical protein